MKFLLTFTISLLAIQGLSADTDKPSTDTPIYQIKGVPNPETNKKFLSWLVETKIPPIYQALFDQAKIPTELSQKAIPELVAFHTDAQSLDLQRSWDNLNGKPQKDINLAEHYETRRLEIRNKLKTIFGPEHYKNFRIAESQEAIESVINLLDINNRGRTPSGLTDDERQNIRTLLNKHLLSDKIIIENSQAAYPAMIKEAKSTLSENAQKFFLARFQNEKSWPVRPYKPSCLAPGRTSARPF